MRKLPALLMLALLTSTAAWAAPPMERAIRSGETAAVLALLDQGAELDGKSGTARMTPLKLAVKSRKPDIVKALLDRGADINIRHRGTSALSLAALAGDLEMVALLLSKKAEVTDRDLQWAQGPRRAEIVEMLGKGLSAAADSASASPFSGIRPSYKLGERPDDFALLIGIGSYMDAPESKSSEADVSLMREHLLALGWPGRNIITLTGKLAGRAGISKYLERWLPNNVVENSRVLFYFSGHGAADPSTRQAYLLPWDGDPGLLETTGYSLVRLYQKLNALGAKEALVVLEAGFAGSDKPDMGIGELGAITALSAAPGREHALTYHLLNGLNARATRAEKDMTLKGLFGASDLRLR